MRNKSGLRIAACIFLAFASGSVLAQSATQRVNAMVRDTQKQGNRAGRFTLVWWIPPEFWRAAMAANGSMPLDKVEEIVSLIRDVNLFSVVDGKFTPLGTMDFVSAEELQKNISLTDTQNRPVPLIPEAKQTVATKNLVAVLKPLLANMLGELGKNMSFLIFEGKNKDGSRLIDPLKQGTFTVKLNGDEFRWRLPLGSLLADKKCPKCNETFPGNYSFCPFDATPLAERK
jgi:hypothetical protein